MKTPNPATVEAALAEVRAVPGFYLRLPATARRPRTFPRPVNERDGIASFWRDDAETWLRSLLPVQQTAPKTRGTARAEWKALAC